MRNLAPLEQISRDPHSLSIFFTIHDPEGSEKGNAHFTSVDFTTAVCSVRNVVLLLLFSSVQEQFCSRKLCELRGCIEFMKRT